MGKSPEPLGSPRPPDPSLEPPPGQICDKHGPPAGGPEEYELASQPGLSLVRAGSATTVKHRHRRSPTVAKGPEEPQVASLPAQAVGMMQAGDSDCGPKVIEHRGGRSPV